MAFGDVRQVKALPITQGTGSPAATAFDSPVAAGSLILVISDDYPAALTGVTSSPSNTFTKDFDQVVGSNHLTIFRAIAGASGTLTVTATASSGTDYVTGVMLEIEGPFHATQPEASNTSTGAFHDLDVASSGSASAAGSAFAVAALIDDQSGGTIGAPTSSFTSRFNDGGGGAYNALAVATRVVAAGTYSTTWQNSGAPGAQDYRAGIVIYKAGSAAPNPRRPFLKTVKAAVGRIISKIRPRGRLKLLRGRLLAPAGQVLAPSAAALTVTVPTPNLGAGVAAMAAPTAQVGVTVPTAALAPGAVAVSAAAAPITVAVPTPTFVLGVPFLRRVRIFMSRVAAHRAAQLRRRPMPAARLLIGSVEAGSAQTLSPSAAAISVTVPSPNLGAGAVTMSVAAAQVSVTVPSASLAPGLVTMAPLAAPVSVTVPVPALVTAGTMAPPAATVNVVVPGALLAPAGVAVSAPSANVTVSVPTPSLSPGVAILAVAPAAVTITAPTAALLTGTLLSPSAAQVAIVVPTALLVAGLPPDPQGAVAVRFLAVRMPSVLAVVVHPRSPR